MLSSVYALLAMAAEQTADAAGAAQAAAGEGFSWLAVLKLFCIVAATFAVPLLVASWLTRLWKMPDYFGRLALVLFVLTASIVISVFGWSKIKLGIDLGGGSILIYEVDEGGLEKVRQQEDQRGPRTAASVKKGEVNMGALTGAISKRVNPGGQREVVVRQYGPRQVEIIIPEADKAEVDRIQDKISRLGSLEFRILATRHRPEYEALIKRAEALSDNETELKSSTGDTLARWVPVQPGREKSFGSGDIAMRTVTLDNQKHLEILVVQDKFDVTGRYLRRARETQDDHMSRAVGFDFDSQGAERFGRLTGEHKPDVEGNFKYHLGILLDGYLFSAPELNAVITSSGIITGGAGGFTEEELKAQIDVLNAGALPTALSRQPINRMTTDTTLGKDTIRTGLLAVGVSVGLVAVFMLVYYRFAGIVACAALVMNMVALLAIMISINAAFTLPGLAGLALTIGMAVDANVLIYERIREELDRSASLRMAIRNGFERAQSAIVDSNLTTMIAAAVLWYVGSDQIKGFAITLFLGLCASLFTAVFCAHVVFDIAERRGWITKLTMMRMLTKTNIDFWGIRYRCYAGSLILIAIGMIGVVFRVADGSLLDIDFTGGVSIQVVFQKEPEGKTDYVRKALEKAGLEDLVVSNVSTADQSEQWRVMVNCSSPPAKKGEEQTNAAVFLAQVEKTIFDTFGDRLVTNSTRVSDLKAVSAPAAAPVKPSAPAPKATSRNDLPPATWLASADPAAVLLAQAKTDGKPADKPAAKADSPAPPAAKAEAKPDAKAPAAPTKPPAAPEKPEAPERRFSIPPAKTDTPARPEPVKTPAADGEARFAKGSQAAITFTQKVTAKEVDEMLSRVLEKNDLTATAVDREITREGFQRNDKNPYADWQLKVNLPPERARKILADFEATYKNQPYFPSSNTIGGKVASDTRLHALYALIVSNLLIMVYLWVRFQRLMYGVAAVVALVHDVLVTMGLLALTKWAATFMGFLLIDPFKIGLTEVAAFLTLVGFSVNDTVVVFDRIREVKGKAQAVTPEVINQSINQTLSRTILTSLTVLIVAIVLYILGGPTIHGFSFLMLTGIITGTYSSVYVASPLLLFGKKHEKPAPRIAAAGGRS